MDDYLFSYAERSDPPLKRGVIRLVERATGQPHLKRLYLQNQRKPRPAESFWQAAVRSLDLDIRYEAAALARAPRTGPAIFVANHPYGVLDGIVMSWLVEKVRPDFLVLTHSVLLRAREVRDFVLPVDLRTRRRRGKPISGPAPPPERIWRGAARWSSFRPAQSRPRPIGLAGGRRSTRAGGLSSPSSSRGPRRS